MLVYKHIFTQVHHVSINPSHAYIRILRILEISDKYPTLLTTVQSTGTFWRLVFESDFNHRKGQSGGWPQRLA